MNFSVICIESQHPSSPSPIVAHLATFLTIFFFFSLVHFLLIDSALLL